MFLGSTTPTCVHAVYCRLIVIGCWIPGNGRTQWLYLNSIIIIAPSVAADRRAPRRHMLQRQYGQTLRYLEAPASSNSAIVAWWWTSRYGAHGRELSYRQQWCERHLMASQQQRLMATININDSTSSDSNTDNNNNPTASDFYRASA